MELMFSTEELVNMSTKKVARIAIDNARTKNFSKKITYVPVYGYDDLEASKKRYYSTSKTIDDLNDTISEYVPLNDYHYAIPFIAALIVLNDNISEDKQYKAMKQALEHGRIKSSKISHQTESDIDNETDEDALKDAEEALDIQYQELLNLADEYEKFTGDTKRANELRKKADSIKAMYSDTISDVKDMAKEASKAEQKAKESKKPKKDKSSKKNEIPFTDEEKSELLVAFTDVFEMNNKAIDATDAARIMSIVNRHYCQKGFKIHKIIGRGIFHNLKDNVYEFVFATKKGDSVILKVDLNTDRVEFLDISEVVA